MARSKFSRRRAWSARLCRWLQSWLSNNISKQNSAAVRDACGIRSCEMKIPETGFFFREARIPCLRCTENENGHHKFIQNSRFAQQEYAFIASMSSGQQKHKKSLCLVSPNLSNCPTIFWQTFRDSFSTVSKPMFPSEHSLESS